MKGLLSKLNKLGRGLDFNPLRFSGQQGLGKGIHHFSQKFRRRHQRAFYKGSVQAGNSFQLSKWLIPLHRRYAKRELPAAVPRMCSTISEQITLRHLTHEVKSRPTIEEISLNLTS